MKWFVIVALYACVGAAATVAGMLAGDGDSRVTFVVSMLLAAVGAFVVRSLHTALFD